MRTRSMALAPNPRLLTRAGLQKALKVALARGQKTGRPLGLILFSIDRFKLINSRFGQMRADTVLHRVGRAAMGGIGRGSRLGRWSGDEFLVILPETNADECRAVAEKLRETTERLIIPVNSSLINVTASFGVACFPDDHKEAEALLVAADEAMYQAKRLGRNRTVCAGDLRQGLFEVGGILEVALREERVIPAYQPIVDLRSGKVVAEEALARIVTADGQVLAAEDFIGAASQFQLVHKVDRTIIKSALDRCAAGGDDAPLYFLNVSGDLLRRPELLREMLAHARVRGLDGRGSSQRRPLVIEMTERELLANLAAARRALEPFLDVGIQLALDDFGSGYSSFQYLADLPVSFLKIDGRLIERVHEPKVRAIVRGIQNIASELELITLAENIESEAQAETLREIGIDWGQGHHYGEAKLDEGEANARRELSVNWAHGYYYQKIGPSSDT